jgi:hypothetical protein
MSYASRSGQTLSGSTSLALTHIVTPEQFAVNQRRLEDAKAVLTSYQASNEQGLEAYMRLQQSIEEGERAK